MAEQTSGGTSYTGYMPPFDPITLAAIRERRTYPRVSSDAYGILSAYSVQDSLGHAYCGACADSLLVSGAIVTDNLCGETCDGCGIILSAISLERVQVMRRTYATDHAARMAARAARKSGQWRSVRRDGRTVSAIRTCTDCGADIATDAELLAHFAAHLSRQ